jgi:hypothetical protein
MDAIETKGALVSIIYITQISEQVRIIEDNSVPSLKFWNRISHPICQHIHDGPLNQLILGLQNTPPQ